MATPSDSRGDSTIIDCGPFLIDRGLRRNFDAVTAGLTLPWSSGPAEGHVNGSR
ncbi:hypothetical protein AB0M45_33015 [Nocardia sp. NPDC051787]|uniref:hypothetical protein n=1 Tax=Nocardia sp. NPDC051787 TaxID=3155415 RepID=UPI00342FA0C6